MEKHHQQLTQFWHDLREACNQNDLSRLIELCEPSKEDSIEPDCIYVEPFDDVLQEVY